MGGGFWESGSGYRWKGMRWKFGLKTEASFSDVGCAGWL